MQTPLGAKMARLAAEGHERAADLREKADAFEAAASGYYGDPQTVGVKTFLGCYARARTLWCECSGEPLV